jgi:hypothetical protein
MISRDAGSAMKDRDASTKAWPIIEGDIRDLIPRGFMRRLAANLS